MNGILGKLRQSAVIMNYGPGAIVDFRIAKTGAAVSVVSAGLDEWELQAEEAGLSIEDLKSFVEPRLAEKLKKRYFRLPPVAPGNADDEMENGTIPLIGARFPTWLQCPECGLVKRARKWASDPGDPSRNCAACSQGLPGNKKKYVVPTRFILACRNGHLDDFPWSWWVHGIDSGCRKDGTFRLENEGAGLAGLVVSCPSCHTKRSLDGIFSLDALKDLKCTGRRPWLADGDEDCGLNPQTLQRGASNLYFPQLESALVIPPWSDRLWASLGSRRDDIVNAESSQDVRDYIRLYVWNDRPEKARGMGFEDFVQAVIDKRDACNRASSGDIRWDEYRQFMAADNKAPRLRGEEFLVRAEKTPAAMPQLSRLLRIESIREIRVLRSFSRIEAPPGGSQFPVRKQFLSKNSKNWLPAIEVRGEGIFLAIGQEILDEWLSSRAVADRAEQVVSPEDSRVLNPDAEFGPGEISPTLVARYLMLHSLAHVLMRQLALQCGYSSASLRERVFVGDGDKSMAGLMIYTATSDADGTLGGLQREGVPKRFTPMFVEALRANEWCSSDPLCIQGLLAATESSSLASCHSCLLAPETSCEDYNRFLDRAMLVGTPEDPSIGFFNPIRSSTEAEV